jgi:hypothetical protein
MTAGYFTGDSMLRRVNGSGRSLWPARERS